MKNQIQKFTPQVKNNKWITPGRAVFVGGWGVLCMLLHLLCYSLLYVHLSHICY